MRTKFLFQNNETFLEIVVMVIQYLNAVNGNELYTEKQYGAFYSMYILQLKKKFEGIPLQSSGYDLGLSLQEAVLDPWLVN